MVEGYASLIRNGAGRALPSLFLPFSALCRLCLSRPKRGWVSPHEKPAAALTPDFLSSTRGNVRTQRRGGERESQSTTATATTHTHTHAQRLKDTKVPFPKRNRLRVSSSFASLRFPLSFVSHALLPLPCLSLPPVPTRAGNFAAAFMHNRVTDA